MTDAEFDAFVAAHQQDRDTFIAWHDARDAFATARAAKFEQLEDELKADLLAVFQSWTPAEQYEFDGARRALADDLATGNLPKVIDAVTNYRAGDTSLDTHRAAILAVLNPAATQFSALAAATSLDAINGIS